MAKFRVKAFFMHESELATAKRAEDLNVITDTEWTDGYLMGVIDEADIQGLAQQGLVITPIEILETRDDASRAASRSVQGITGGRRKAALSLANAQGAQPLASSVAHKTVRAKILSAIEDSAQFYVVRLNGPLTEQRRSELLKVGVSLLERLSNDKYTARLTGNDVRTLAAQQFVDSIRLYSETDTLQPSRSASVRLDQPKTRAAQASGDPSFTLIHAIRLHRAEDIAVVRKWLLQRGRKPLSENADVLRVALPQGGLEVTELAKLREVATVEEILPTRPLDRIARGIMRLEDNNLTLGLEGEGELIGIADTGLDDMHPDFQGRIVRIIPRGRPGQPGDSCRIRAADHARRHRTGSVLGPRATQVL
jgi:hypothetical protein